MPPSSDDRIKAAIDLILDCGWIDGAHHKQWTLDQVLRILCGSEERYREILPEGWDEGIAP